MLLQSAMVQLTPNSLLTREFVRILFSKKNIDGGGQGRQYDHPPLQKLFTFYLIWRILVDIDKWKFHPMCLQNQTSILHQVSIEAFYSKYETNDLRGDLNEHYLWNWRLDLKIHNLMINLLFKFINLFWSSAELVWTWYHVLICETFPFG